MKQQEKYLLTDDQKKLFFEIKNHVEYSAYTMRDRRAKWKTVWELWVQSKNTDVPKFRANSRLPIARTAVNTFASFLSAKEPTFNVYPIGSEDWMKAQLSRELLQYQAKKPDILDLKRKAKILIKSTCLFDVGIAKVTWKTTTTIDSKGKKKVLKDAPFLENVHTMDFFPDPYIGRMQDQVKVVERMVIPIDELKANPNYTIPIDMQASYTDAQNRETDSSRLNVVDLQTNQGGEKVQGKVEVWECWTKSMVYTVADPYGTPVFIQEKENPYGCIPYVKMDFEVEPVPNRFYGYGMLVPNIDINKAIDGILNNIRDNVNILVNPMYKIRRGSRIDPRQLISRPGGAVDVENMGDIDQLRSSDTTGAGYNMFNLQSNLFQQGTRVSSVRSGQQGSADTATEAEIQQQNADVVTNAVKDNFEQALSEIGTMVLKMNVENMQGSTSIRIFNPDLIKSLSDRYLKDTLTPEQQQEALATGQLAGYDLNDQMLEEIRLYGHIKPEPMSQEDEYKIKTYGQLIKYSKQFIDVDSDVIVEADSTLKKDSAVLRKQVSDVVNIIARVPGGVEKIDWELYAATMADLTGIPAIKKFIKQSPPPAPAMPMQAGMAQQPSGIPGAENRPPAVDEMLSNQAIAQSVRSPQSQI